MAIFVFVLLAIIKIIKKDKLKGKKQFKLAGISAAVMIVSFIIFGVIAEPSSTAKDEEDKVKTVAKAETEGPKENDEEKAKREEIEAVLAKVEVEQKAKEEAEIKAKAEPVVASTWQDKVKEVASMAGTTGEKFDAISLYAMDYPVTKEEKNTFLAGIIAEYKEGRYIADLANDEYMLTNLFKSQAIDEFYDNKNVNAEQDFAFDFWQNSKYTYRGVDAIDSDAVRANERQMDKALKKIK